MTDHKRFSNKKTKGFTLIEVLIALVIISVGIAGVIKYTIQSINVNSILIERTYASWVAENRLVELRNSEERFRSGAGTYDMGGLQWRVRERITSISVNLNRVELEVFGPDSDEPDIVVVSFVPNPLRKNPKDG